MKKILVPTDFSELSKPSVFYAAMLAKKMKSEIVLLHVIDISNSETLLKKSKLEDELIQIAMDESEELIRELKDETGFNLPVQFEYRLGHPLHKIIENYVAQKGFDLIVMGTHGATGIQKRIMGSMASSIINNSSVPVIAIPPDAALKLRKIFYATDLVNLSDELKLLTDFAKVFNASIHVVHVSESGSTPTIDRKKIQSLIEQEKYSHIYFHVLEGGDVADRIVTFVRSSSAHLLAMFTHKLDFFEKLLGKSITQELAFQNHLPLLTFNKSKLQKAV